jgi:hypothetical protein
MSDQPADQVTAVSVRHFASGLGPRLTSPRHREHRLRRPDDPDEVQPA